MTYDPTEHSPKTAFIQRCGALLLGLPASYQIILSPGVLVALRVLFAALGVRKILLSDEEYYGAAHFHGAEVRVEPVDAIPSVAQSWRPDAVMVSAVTWRGRAIDVRSLFSSIREACGPRAPVLVADGSHLGAAGFPALNDSGADLLCGDFGKWLMPPREGKNGIAFLAACEPELAATALSTFECFFLATSLPPREFAARWLDPHQIDNVHAALASRSLSREAIDAWHLRNQELTGRVAAELGMLPSGRTSILWLPASVPETDTLRTLDRAGLVWHQPEVGVRVLCRADVLERSLDS